jgi:hypothetical protein
LVLVAWISVQHVDPVPDFVVFVGACPTPLLEQLAFEVRIG